jgi:hypothetical protein
MSFGATVRFVAVALLFVSVPASASAGADAKTPSVSAPASLSVSPSRVRLVPGAHGTIHVTNSGARAVVVVAGPAGYALDLRGRPTVPARSGRIRGGHRDRGSTASGAPGRSSGAGPVRSSVGRGGSRCRGAPAGDHRRHSCGWSRCPPDRHPCTTSAESRCRTHPRVGARESRQRVGAGDRSATQRGPPAERAHHREAACGTADVAAADDRTCRPALPRQGSRPGHRDRQACRNERRERSAAPLPAPPVAATTVPRGQAGANALPFAA